MSEQSHRLIIHGAPASQPSRAVYWTCMIKALAFELKPLGMSGWHEYDPGHLNVAGHAATGDALVRGLRELGYGD